MLGLRLPLYLQPRMLLMFALGFGSGLPLLLTGSTLLAWLVGVGVPTAQLGLFSLCSMPYSLKLLWAPLLDRVAPLPRLGRRRGWMLGTQLLLVAAIMALGSTDPAHRPLATAGLALLVAALSATQDIAVDAYRTDLLSPEQAAAGTAAFVFGYRTAMVVAGALALRLFDSLHGDFRRVYFIMAAAMLPAVLATLLAPVEPAPAGAPPAAGFARMLLDPLRDFFQRPGALLILLGVAMFSDGTGSVPGLSTDIGVLPMLLVWAILIVLTLAGLRDKVIFLAARGEVYASFTVAFLFAGFGVDTIIAAKLVCLAIWMGAATSKLNKHFPFVISTMMSNSPVVRPRALKRLFFEHFPDDLRPGRLSRIVAHFSTAIEMLIPLALFFSHGGWPTAVAAFVMVVFHLGILTAIPMGVPLEWNVFMIFSVLALFVGHAGVGITDLSTPWPVVLFAVLVCSVTLGNLFPRKVSFLPGMRYYAGNWDSSLWCIKPSASEKIAQNLVAIASMPQAQLEKVYGSPEAATVLQYLGYSFRCFNTHGRMMYTLAHRAMAGPSGAVSRDGEKDYVMTDGERICSTAIGWNFGDGHMHNEQLIAAMQRRCHFEPGEVRVVLIDAQPIHVQAQRYRLVDAAAGEFESGYIRVSDAVTRQPWDDNLPVHVDR